MGAFCCLFLPETLNRYVNDLFFSLNCYTIEKRDEIDFQKVERNSLKNVQWFFSRKIPVTLQDGEEFGRGEKFYHFACFVDEGKGEDVQDKKMKTDIKSANWIRWNMYFLVFQEKNQ